MQDYFYSLSDQIMKSIDDNEVLLLNISGEDSDFVRFNNNKIRQAGGVMQRTLSLDLVIGKRHAQAGVDIVGELSQDKERILSVVKELRGQCNYIPEDPYLLYSSNVENSESHNEKSVVESTEAVEQIIRSADKLDMVGIWANGTMYSGFANSLGQRNWHSSTNFNFDWSCYHAKDKAVKNNYAGFDWQASKLNSKMENVRQQLSYISRKPKTIEPGRYRAYLAPSALEEIIGMMSWGGFGLKSHRTKETPLIEMIEKGKTLSDSISIIENHSRGLVPGFTDKGFMKPNNVKLISNGAYDQCLVEPRSAMEYDQDANAESEYPESLEVSAGNLASESILKSLDTGLYINNLWYLNFSDRNHCRLTGMTRFACFWVENGEIQAPINVMRFDDSIYELLGSNLLGSTEDREFIFDSSTYGERSKSSIELPGILVNDMNFTL